MSFRNVSEVTVLVDYSNAVYRSYHATEKEGLINSKGMNVGFIIGMAKLLMFAIGKTKKMESLPKLVLCEDRSPTRKRNLYRKYYKELLCHKQDKLWDGVDEKERIRYKGNRQSMDIDFDPLEVCRKFLKCVPCTKIYCDGEEADDVIASYVNDHKDEKILVYSTDKDLWQLIPDYKNMEIILGDGSSPTEESCEKYFDVKDFKKIALHKIIKGDIGDNVKSLNRFQFKKNLDVYVECDGTPEDYLRLLVKKQGKDGKDVKHFLDHIGMVCLNKELVKLVTDLNYEVEVIKVSSPKKWNWLCEKYEVPSLLNSPLLRIY